MEKSRRSLLARFRLGVFSIAIETGRYNRVPLQERLCCICHNGEIEDEIHFLCNCKAYENERQKLYCLVSETQKNFHKWKFLKSLNY